MDFDAEENQLLEKAQRRADRNNNKVYVVQFNLRNTGTKAQLLEWDKGTKKVTGERILFTIAIFN